MFQFMIDGLPAEFHPAKAYMQIDSEPLSFNTSVREPREKIYLKITNACNINCVYCFQQEDHKKVFTFSVKDYKALLYEEINKPNRDIIVFGGEPFLKQNIDNLSEVFRICQNNRISFYTNGCYGKEIKDLLYYNKNKIFNMQISLDGPEHIHNSRRINPSGNGYQLIVSNCQELLAQNIPFNIQVNIDSTNIEGVASLLEDLVRTLGPTGYTVVLNRVLGLGDAISEKELLELFIHLVPKYGSRFIFANSNTLKRMMSFFTDQGYMDHRCDIAKTRIFDFEDNTIYACPHKKDSPIGTFSDTGTDFYYNEISKYYYTSYKKNAVCKVCCYYHFCDKGCVWDKIDYSKCKNEVHDTLQLIFRHFDYFFAADDEEDN